MFNFLKNKEALLQNKTIKLLEQQRVASSNKIKSIGILTTDKLLNQFDLNDLVKRKLDIEPFSIFSFKDFSKDLVLSNTCFTEKSISKKGKPLEENFKDFLNNPFDLLICFFDEKNTFLEYASVISKATYKAGFSNVNNLMLDLEIKSETTNVDEFLSELKKYLTILNKI